MASTAVGFKAEKDDGRQDSQVLVVWHVRLLTQPDADDLAGRAGVGEWRGGVAVRGMVGACVVEIMHTEEDS